MKILSKKKSFGYFTEKSIYLFDNEIYYRISKDNYSKKYYFGFSSNKTERQYFAPYMKQLEPYDTIIVIDSNIGEAFLTLKLLPSILNKIKAKKTAIIITQKYHQQLIELFNYNHPCFFIPELHYSVMKSYFKIGKKNFYICYSHVYYRKIEKSLTGKKPIHFYNAIIQHFHLNKKSLINNTPQLNEKNQVSLNKKIQDINLNIDNFVIISPEANSCKQLNPEFWSEIVEQLNKQNIDVFLNTVKECNIPNAKSCYLSFEELCILLKKARGSIFLRSGLCDIATSFITTPSVILYSDLHFMANVDTLAGFSVMPFTLNKSLIKEFNAREKQEFLIKKIMEVIL